MPRSWILNFTEDAPTRYVYFAHDGEPDKRVKIGVSLDPRWRLPEIHCHLIFAVPCNYGYALKLERKLHDRFAALRLPRRPGNGGTEWFSVDNELQTLIDHVLETGVWVKAKVVVPA